MAISKNESWELFEIEQEEQENKYQARLDFYPRTIEEAFDTRSTECIYFSCYEDHYMYNKDEDEHYAKYIEAYLEWHHLPSEETPYWTKCTDRIITLLETPEW
jgi:hypothetical protein